MRKIKEVYKMEIANDIELELEINEYGNVKIIRAQEFQDTYLATRNVYCKPNITFTIIKSLDIEEQVFYHLQQRDRIKKINDLIRNTKTMLDNLYGR